MGRSFLVELVTCCLFLLYCQCFAYSQLLFGKVVKNIQWRKDSLFYKSSWEHWISTCKRIKSHLFLQHAQVSTQDRYRPEHKTWNCKTPRRKHRGNFMTWIWQWLYERYIKSQTNGCELGVPHQFFYMDAKYSSSTCWRDHPSHCSAEPPQTYMRSPLCVSLCWSIGQFLCPWVNTTLTNYDILIFSVSCGKLYSIQTNVFCWLCLFLCNIIISWWIFTQKIGRHLIRIP